MACNRFTTTQINTCGMEWNGMQIENKTLGGPPVVLCCYDDKSDYKETTNKENEKCMALNTNSEYE